jgi:Fe-S oxidoreductase
VEDRVDLFHKKIKVTGTEMVVVACHSCHSQLNSLKKEYSMEGLAVKYLWKLVADSLIL